MKKSLLFALSLLAISFANADAASGSGAYVNINTGFATMQALPTGSWTGNINAGYNFNRNFALEGGYNLFANQQFGVSTTTNIFDVAAKGTLPLSESFSLYGRLGLGLGVNSWSGNANSNCVLCQSNDSTYMLGLAGIGASYALSNNIDLHLEDTMYVPFASSFVGSSINAVTLGLQYNF
ncbi:MAG: outer membrane beta-barrel protein [Burkholderiales bacterium]|nr:outer membrane beta-barrel protein [Burkholderiales bacterium]